MVRVRAIAAVVLMFALGACALTYTRVGKGIPDTDGLVIGVTTSGEALAQLGPPRFVRQQFDSELYVWRRLRGHSRSFTLLPILVRVFFWENAVLLRDDVALLFDHGGVLRGVGRRIESEEPDDRPPAEEDAAF